MRSRSGFLSERSLMTVTSRHQSPLAAGQTAEEEVTLLGLGVIGSSAKENEHRLPLHPQHIPQLDADLRARITLEHGYGARFGIDDASLGEHVAGFASREEILSGSDVVLLPKPQLADVAALGPGQVLWGWPHCVQDYELTQLAIDRRLTLVAFEAMNHWTRDGGVGLHVFHKNNELAGYCSVLHALELAGLTGDYGRRLSAVVIGFGATARGAVTALNAHGVHEVAVLTHRDVAAVGSPIHSVRIRQFDHDPDGLHLGHVITERGREPLPTYLAENDIVVNCTLQDPANPLIYLRTEELAGFRPGRSSWTCPATGAWASAGLGRRPSRSRLSSWGRTSSTTRWITARRTCGARRPGRTATRSNHSCARWWKALPRGRPTRR